MLSSLQSLAPDFIRDGIGIGNCAVGSHRPDRCLPISEPSGLTTASFPNLAIEEAGQMTDKPNNCGDRIAQLRARDSRLCCLSAVQ